MSGLKNNATPDTDSPADSLLKENLQKVRDRMSQALEAASRTPDSVRLVAISKFHPCSSIASLFRAGQTVFGENYLQEAQKKQDELSGCLGLEWHFTGHLQSKKAKEVLGNFKLIHTLDSLSLGESLNKAWQKNLDNGIMTPPQEVLIQVNTGREPQKSGVMPEDLPALAEKIQQFSAIRITGLMCLPPFTDKPEDSREHFIALRELKERLILSLGCDLPVLSMGMSHDFEIAIAEGATLIRIGTDIFGPRPARAS